MVPAAGSFRPPHRSQFSAESYVRLISCYLLEYSEDWLTERSYVRKEAIEAAKARMAEAA